jgi:hypothetical protein
LPRTVFREQSVLPEVQKSKGYVFISYADEDYEFIVQLRNFLKGKGYAFWDFQESERDYHSLAFLELETAIREAVGFLGVISPDWKRSKWTPKELLFSEEVGTPIFLLKVRPTEATLLIAGMSYIDFTRDCDDAFGKLDRQLKRKGL